MFTGLVETVGVVRQVRSRANNRLLTIETDFAPELQIGESVTVQGCCLTVTDVSKRRFEVEVTKKTLTATTLGMLSPEMLVNLERALKMGDRIGGHMVLGHIDEVGRIKRLIKRSGETEVIIGIDPKNARLVVPKGSVAIDGVSLTVQKVGSAEFSVNLIPFTGERTTLKTWRTGIPVNIEYDIIVKSAQQLSGPNPRM